MNVTVWTESYNPMQMGGNLRRPIATEMDLHNCFNAGKGFLCYEIKSPDESKTIIVEMSSGAIVGNSKQQVIKDIADCHDIAMMQKQIMDAKNRIKSPDTRFVSNTEFWDIYCKNKN